jgi:hypothetical protein
MFGRTWPSSSVDLSTFSTTDAIDGKRAPKHALAKEDQSVLAIVGRYSIAMHAVPGRGWDAVSLDFDPEPLQDIAPVYFLGNTIVTIAAARVTFPQAGAAGACTARSLNPAAEPSDGVQVWAPRCRGLIRVRRSRQERAYLKRRAAQYRRATARLKTLQKQAERNWAVCLEQGH